MNLLAYYIVAKNCEERLAKMMRFQRQILPGWDELPKLFIIEEGQKVPETNCTVVRMPFFKDGKIMFSQLKNAGIDYATANGYDWLLDCDADTAILKMPTFLPQSGYGSMRCYFTKEQESHDSVLERARSRTIFYDESVGSSRFLTHRNVFTQCRYFEGLSGYGGEDLDYHETVLPCAGIHTTDTDMRGVHFWHPLNYRPHGEGDHELRVKRRMVRDAVYAAEKVEGWMGTTELAWLASKAQQANTIIEVGSWKGRSTKAIAFTCPGTVYAVDDFSGGVNPADTLAVQVRIYGSNYFAEEFKRIMAAELQAQKVVLVRKPFKDAVSALPQADMIFIDGDHSFESVAQDIENAKKLLKPGGLLCGHDMNLPGVVQAVTNLVPGFKYGPGSIWYQ